MNLAIICSCLPTLRPLLSRFSSTFRGPSYGARSYGYSQQPPGTPGMMNSRPISHRASRIPTRLPPKTEEPEFALKDITVTTEIKQNFSGSREKEDSISSEGSASGVKDQDFV